MDLRAYLLERLPAVETALEAALPPASEAPAALHGAMRHLLFPGGKRLRMRINSLHTSGAFLEAVEQFFESARVAA